MLHLIGKGGGEGGNWMLLLRRDVRKLWVAKFMIVWQVYQWFASTAHHLLLGKHYFIRILQNFNIIAFQMA
jgi:hypothetical protein